MNWLQRFKYWLRDTTPALELHCPVCGYLCLGRGGMGCIDKPTLVRLEQMGVDAPEGR